MTNKIDKEFPPIITEEDYSVVRAMDKYGGSFLKALASAFYKADHINFNKLKKAFPLYWKKYKQIAETKNECNCQYKILINKGFPKSAIKHNSGCPLA